MQCFKLVNTGYVDKVIVFDTLPEWLLQGIRTREVSGFPRAWAKWLIQIGSVRPVFKTTTTQHPDRSYSFHHTPIGKEPCFYVLEYQDLNADKEKWFQICDYLRQHCGPEVRLKEKVGDMALALAPNCNTPLSVECEDVPVIHVASVEKDMTVTDEDIVKPNEQIVVNEEPKPAPKKRGRPKKVLVEA